MKVIILGTLKIRLDKKGKVTIDSQGSEWKGDLDDLISTLTKTNSERKEAA